MNSRFEEGSWAAATTAQDDEAKAATALAMRAGLADRDPGVDYLPPGPAGSVNGFGNTWAAGSSDGGGSFPFDGTGNTWAAA
jgi:hypothetical protein